MQGWLVYHSWLSIRSEPGFVDLVLVGHGRVLFRELKTGTGKTTSAQDAWITALRANGADVDVWRPADWERVQAELRPLRARGTA